MALNKGQVKSMPNYKTSLEIMMIPGDKMRKRTFNSIFC